MAVRQRAADGEDLRGGRGRNDGSALEKGLEALEEFGRPVGEVEEGALLDLPALAVGLAQQDGRGRAAVGDDLDVHVHRGSHEAAGKSSGKRPITCLHFGLPTPRVRRKSMTCHYRKQEVPVKYSQSYVAAERGARQAKRGVFAHENTPLWDFRAGKWGGGERLFLQQKDCKAVC